MVTERRYGSHSPRAESVRENLPRKRVESFRFDPNTVSVEDLCRLGFTPKQAQSIDNYRKKGSISEITSLYDKIISSYKSKDKTTFNEITNNKIDIDDISYIVLRTYSNGWSNLTDVLNKELQSYYLNNGKILILSNK